MNLKSVLDSVMAARKIKFRTSKDVYDRLCWDSQLDSNLYTVGYKDRFRGMVELGLGEFRNSRKDMFEESWIPWHRVYWFKREGDIIWDREKKIDKIFTTV